MSSLACLPLRSAILAALLVLSACSDKVPQLMNHRNTTGTPDEFAVVPARPLETPSNTSVLPPPTPGSGNRADQSPVADAMVALGGSGTAATRAGIPAGDSALIGHAGRYGTNPAIRGVLAEEDLEWRRNNKPRLLPRIAGTNTYYSAYARQSLDQAEELERLRRAGVTVPSAPPVATSN